MKKGEKARLALPIALSVYYAVDQISFSGASFNIGFDFHNILLCCGKEHTRD
jgi:hypothetical protein